MEMRLEPGFAGPALVPTPLPEKRRHGSVSSPSASAYPMTFQTNQPGSSGLRREQDAGVRLDVPNEDDMTETMSLPPAYNEITRSVPQVRAVLPRVPE